MAGSSPLTAFQGAAASTDAQKAALGSMIAAQGSAGAASFKAEQAVQAAMAKQAGAGVPAANPGIGQPNMSSAVGPGELTQMLAARAGSVGAMGAQQMGQAGAEFNKYAGLIGDANNSYMDAVKGAIPIVQSQTQAQIAQINADLAYKREQRQAEADAQAQARVDAALARKEHDEDRDYEIGQRMLKEAERRKEAKLAAPAGSSEAFDALGFKGDATTLTSSPVYGDLYETAVSAAKAYGESLDQDQLVGILNAEHARLVQEGIKNGTPVNANHPKIMSLILAQMQPLFGQKPSKSNADTAYRATVGQTLSEIAAKQRRGKKASNDFLGHGAGNVTPRPPDPYAAYPHNPEPSFDQQTQAGLDRAVNGPPPKDHTVGDSNLDMRKLTEDQLFKVLARGNAGSADYIMAQMELERRGVLPPTHG